MTCDAGILATTNVLDQPVHDRVSERKERDLLSVQGDREVERHSPDLARSVLVRKEPLKPVIELEKVDAREFRIGLDTDSEFCESAEYKCLQVRPAHFPRPG